MRLIPIVSTATSETATTTMENAITEASTRATTGLCYDIDKMIL